MPQDGEIDLLIATDCISEGQNLQDCDLLVNYDIHWNPVRIIQRFGRIDRIGSINAAVQLVNFWPTQDLDKYITLKARVEARMALVDITATAADNVLATSDLEDAIRADLRYRDQQLLRMKDEVLDMEDLGESVTLTEFTLDDFRIELLNYLASNRARLQNAPLGLFAVVPANPDYVGPGVIYCLRQKGAGADSKTVNPLQPYFMVYVQADNQVRYSFAQPRQILEIYRLLCADKKQPFAALCRLFDTETHNGTAMGVSNALLERALASIASTFERRVTTALQAGRDAVLPDQSLWPAETSDFELVTWLVIK
jgi:hypothetical protein